MLQYLDKEDIAFKFLLLFLEGKGTCHSAHVKSEDNFLSSVLMGSSAGNSDHQAYIHTEALLSLD